MAGYENFERLLAAIPAENEEINWAELEFGALQTVFQKMKNTDQNPIYHAEGSVFRHTVMVCEALVAEQEYKKLKKEQQKLLFIAALLHDIGKIECTRITDGEIASPHHSSVGAVMARELLWREFGLCGERKKQTMREYICALIRYHSYPPFAISDKNAERKINKIATLGGVADGFTLHALYLLERADAIGRISKSQTDYLERVEYFRTMAEELGCYTAQYPFLNPYSRWAYFHKKTDWVDNDIFSDRWGEVILLSGLPGTGKDTWIRENHPDMPVISLDEIRLRLHILPTENQGAVIAEESRTLSPLAD